MRRTLPLIILPVVSGACSSNIVSPVHARVLRLRLPDHQCIVEQ